MLRVYVLLLLAAGSLAAQTAVVGDVRPIPACVGAPGNTTGPYGSLCEVRGTGALWACTNSGGCTTSGHWTAAGGGSSTARALTFTADGGSTAPVAGSLRCTQAVAAGTIQSWTILGNVSGSIQFDLWKAAFGASLPTVANTIVASAPPVLSSAVTATSSTLTGWTTSITAGDVVCVSLTSATTLTSATLIVKVQ